MSKKFNKSNLIWMIMVPLGILLDQLTKYFANIYLANGEKIVIIKDFFSLTLVKNPGMAWGLLQNRFILTSLSLICCIVIAIYYFKGKHCNLTKVALSMIFTGAVGNLIDRAFFGVVTDMLDINLFVFFGGEFPVCNIADLFVSYGAIVLAISVLFVEKE